MRRTTLTFRLSGHDVQRDLIHEFALHHGVNAAVGDSDGVSTIEVETVDTPTALWDVRATVSSFDDDAEEVGPQ